MKKTKKTYEAPVAEMIEIQMPAVLMASGTGTSTTPQNAQGGAMNFTQGYSW